MKSVDVSLRLGELEIPLSTQHYTPDVLAPQGYRQLTAFEATPWPRWTFRVSAEWRVLHELVVPRGSRCVALSWRLEPTSSAVHEGADSASLPGASLIVRPFLSGASHHSLNPCPAVDERVLDETLGEPSTRVEWTLRLAGEADLGVDAIANGRYAAGLLTYRSFLYRTERERGFDHTEDLVSPGTFVFSLKDGAEALLVLAADGPRSRKLHSAAAAVKSIRIAERLRRGRLRAPLDRAADACIVRRGDGRTVMAGYPWFTDWGRDTFISLRGLAMARGNWSAARDILFEWARSIDSGMVPNRFPDSGASPEFNSVDASLWFVVACHDLLQGASMKGIDRETLRRACRSIVTSYAGGVRHGIAMDPADSLLRAGASGTQLTWMDAKVGERVITPRIGKPVEIQALWINALRIVAAFGEADDLWMEVADRATMSFAKRFADPSTGGLYDVVDDGHVPGRIDASVRPNQIFAIGGLPFSVLDPKTALARSIVDLVERELWTPAGLRSLSPRDARYESRYEGNSGERDAAYHQGTVWPWLLGAFVEAWVRVRGNSKSVVADARRLFLEPLLSRLDTYGLGHASEIADGDEPHKPNGCPFQAWSVGEALRLDRVVLKRVNSS